MVETSVGTRAGHRGDVGDLVAAAVVTAWVVLLAAILRHPIFVSHDTIISYAHVWYVNGQIEHAHRVPWRMPIVGHGQGFAFPYGVVPWLTAALARPLFGDWTVTLWLVGGTVGLIVATFAAFPELRRGWWAAAVLLNPALVVAPIIGQLPFIWAMALLMAAIACWRRHRWGWATALAAAAQLTHIAVVGPIAAIVVVLGLVLLPDDRRPLVGHYLLSLLLASPAAWVVYHSPVFAESSLWVRASNFVGTVAPRALVAVVPIALTVVRGRYPRSRRVAPASAAILVLALVALWGPLGMPFAWGALGRTPDTAMTRFTDSPEFRPGDTYRVLRVSDGKVGMYQLLRAGGRLDSEFFPESILRQSWPDTRTYSALLRSRDVDDVMIWRGYIDEFQVNEQALLDRLAAHPPAACDGPEVCVRRVERTPDYVLYHVDRG